MAAQVLTALFLWQALTASAFAEKAPSKPKAAPLAPALAAVESLSSEPLILGLAKRGQEAEDEEERKTEMALRNPLEASEKCCNRYDRGGEAHNGWPPQKIAAFLKGGSLEGGSAASGAESAPSSDGASDGSGSQ